MIVAFYIHGVIVPNVESLMQFWRSTDTDKFATVQNTWCYVLDMCAVCQFNVQSIHCTLEVFLVWL